MNKKQIERQDFVDGEIFDLICTVAPKEQPDWNIEMIAEVREIVEHWLTRLGFCTRQQFYPWEEEDVEN